MSNSQERSGAQLLTYEQIDALMDDRIHQAAARQDRRGALRRIDPNKRKGMVRRIMLEVFRGSAPLSSADIRDVSDHALHATGESILGASPGSFLDPKEVEASRAEIARMSTNGKLDYVHEREHLLEQRRHRERK